jgi:hypothetical protein
MNFILLFAILFALFIIHVNSQEPSTPKFQNMIQSITENSIVKTIGFPICNCYNGGSCDESTGSCICLPQYSGKFCETRK